MIKFINVTKIYEPKTVGVKNINLHIRPGEFVSIVGQSGTGKTTFVKLIMAELRVNKGKIIIGGWDICGIIVEIEEATLVFRRNDMLLMFEQLSEIDDDEVLADWVLNHTRVFRDSD